tara:strand:+ start:1393 stop:1743 length:351 start_codon:yes stop_codon:yes gene_type:complete
MGNILQDMMGMLTRKKIATPKTDDFITIARYATVQERLKPNPKIEAELVTMGSIKTFTNTGLNFLPLAGGTISGNLNVAGAIDLTTASEGVIFTSPNGTRFKQTVDNEGAPIYTEL